MKHLLFASVIAASVLPCELRATDQHPLNSSTADDLKSLKEFFAYIEKTLEKARIFANYHPTNTTTNLIRALEEERLSLYAKYRDALKKQTEYANLVFKEKYDTKDNELRVGDSNLSVFPPDIFQHTEIRSIVINDSQISEIPRDIKNLNQLKSLVLQRAPISILPDEIKELTNLGYLTLDGTRVGEKGNFKKLLSLPKLNHLSLQNVLLNADDIKDLEELIKKGTLKWLWASRAGNPVGLLNNLKTRYKSVKINF